MANARSNARTWQTKSYAICSGCNQRHKAIEPPNNCPPHGCRCKRIGKRRSGDYSVCSEIDSEEDVDMCLQHFLEILTDSYDPMSGRTDSPDKEGGPDDSKDPPINDHDHNDTKYVPISDSADSGSQRQTMNVQHDILSRTQPALDATKLPRTPCMHCLNVRQLRCCSCSANPCQRSECDVCFFASTLCITEPDHHVSSPLHLMPNKYTSRSCASQTCHRPKCCSPVHSPFSNSPVSEFPLYADNEPAPMECKRDGCLSDLNMKQCGRFLHSTEDGSELWLLNGTEYIVRPTHSDSFQSIEVYRHDKVSGSLHVSSEPEKRWRLSITQSRMHTKRSVKLPPTTWTLAIQRLRYGRSHLWFFLVPAGLLNGTMFIGPPLITTKVNTSILLLSLPVARISGYPHKVEEKQPNPRAFSSSPTFLPTYCRELPQGS